MGAGGNQLSWGLRHRVNELLVEYGDTLVALTLKQILLQRTQYDSYSEFVDWLTALAEASDAGLRRRSS